MPNAQPQHTNPCLDNENDIEAVACNDHEVEESESIKDSAVDNPNQDGTYVVSYSLLNRTIVDQYEAQWELLVQCANNWGSQSTHPHIHNNHSYPDDHLIRTSNGLLEGFGDSYTLHDSDSLYEIGCRVGHEEVAAFKVLQRAFKHSVSSQILARTVIGRSSIPGRIFAEVGSLAEAQKLALTIRELSTSLLRKLLPHERLRVLGHVLSHLQPQTWVRVLGNGKWGNYRGDTGLVHEMDAKKVVMLIPRLESGHDGTRPEQQLARPTEFDSASGLAWTSQGQLYTAEGFLAVDLDAIDVMTRNDILPTTSELEVFGLCAQAELATLTGAASVIGHSRLNIGDRVRIFTGDYHGLIGNIVEISDEEVSLYLETQDVTERMARHHVRVDVQVGDHIKVVKGDKAGLVGWVIEIVGNMLCIVNLEAELEKEVNVHLREVEFYIAPLAAVLHPRSHAEVDGGAKNPNQIYVGKKVLVVGAHLYKGCRALIKDTSPDGYALIELEAHEQKVVRISLPDLSIQREVEDQELFLDNSTSFQTPSTRTPIELLSPPPQLSAPLPPSLIIPIAQQWPSKSVLSSRHIDARWLTDKCWKGFRVKLVSRESAEDESIKELLEVLGDQARVRDGSKIKLVDITALLPLHPAAKDDLVTPWKGESARQIFRVRKMLDDTCVVHRYPTKRLKKNEEYPSFPISSLIQIFPSFRQ